MKKALTIIRLPDLDAVRMVLHNRTAIHYSEQVRSAIVKARAAKTKGRARQRAIAAGRLAMGEQLFKQFPALEGRWNRLTDSLRFLGFSTGQLSPDQQSRFFLSINEAGARGIGLGDLL